MAEIRDTERSVLGALILDNQKLWEVQEIITPREFYFPTHELIYSAIVSLIAKGNPADAITVSDELHSRGELARVGGAAYVHELTSATPTAANVTFYAGIVHEAYMRRRLEVLGASITERANSEGEITALLSNVQDQFAELVTGASSTVTPIGSRIDNIVQSLDEEPKFTPTPWRHINGHIAGFRPGTLCVIAARPGAGKTMLALQSAVALAEKGAVAFITLEMDEAELGKRLLASIGSVSMTSISRNRLAPGEFEKLENAKQKIKSLPLYFSSTANTFLKIKAFIQQVRMREPLQAVVIDYLGLIPAENPKHSRWEAVGELSRNLKLLSKELNVPILVLVQLNRESEKMRRLPILSDLRDSGAIEQDADVVLMLQRQMKDNQFTDDLDVVVAKNRQGTVGTVTLKWEAEYMRAVTAPWLDDRKVEMPYRADIDG